MNMWFNNKKTNNIIHLLKLEILNYEVKMLEFQLRQKDWENKKNENNCMSEKGWEVYKEGQIKFSHDGYLECYYKKQAIEKVYVDFISINQ